MVLHDGSSFETVEEKRLEEDRLHKKVSSADATARVLTYSTVLET